MSCFLEAPGFAYTTIASFKLKLARIVLLLTNLGCMVRVHDILITIACEQALLFGRVKRVSRERLPKQESLFVGYNN